MKREKGGGGSNSDFQLREKGPYSAERWVGEKMNELLSYSKSFRYLVLGDLPLGSGVESLNSGKKASRGRRSFYKDSCQGKT